MLQITLKENSYVLSLLGHKFDAKYASIETKTEKDFYPVV